MKKVYLVMADQFGTSEWDDDIATSVEACYDSKEEAMKAVEHLSKLPDPEPDFFALRYYCLEMEVKNKFIPFSENEDSAE